MVSSQVSSALTGSSTARKSAVRKDQDEKHTRKSMGVQFADFSDKSDASSPRGSVCKSEVVSTASKSEVVSTASKSEVTSIASSERSKERKSRVQFNCDPMSSSDDGNSERSSGERKSKVYFSVVNDEQESLQSNSASPASKSRVQFAGQSPESSAPLLATKPRVTLKDLIANRRSVASASGRASTFSSAPLPSRKSLKRQSSVNETVLSHNVQKVLERSESPIEPTGASLAAMSVTGSPKMAGSPKSCLDENIEDDRRSVVTTLTSVSCVQGYRSNRSASTFSRRSTFAPRQSRFGLDSGAGSDETATPMDFFNAATMKSPNQAHEIQRLFRQGDAVTGHQHGRKAVMAALAAGNEEEVEEEVRFETPEELATALSKEMIAKRCSALVREGSFNVLHLMSLDNASTSSGLSPKDSSDLATSPMSTSSLRMRNAPWASGKEEEDAKDAKKSLSARSLKSLGGLDAIKLPPSSKKSLKETIPADGKNKKGPARYCCRFMVPKEIAEATDFRAPSYLIGPRGQNMKRIFEETDSKLRVRGQNSGHKEGPEQKEAQEPLQVCVSSDSREQNERTKAMVMTLFDKMIFDYAKSRNRRRSEFKVDVINGH